MVPAKGNKPAEPRGGETEVLQDEKGVSGKGNYYRKDLREKCAMIGAKMNKRKSRNGLRPRPDMPDIPGAMRMRARNKKAIVRE